MYALVYSTWTAEEWWFVAASILVSIGSMAFAFSGIDLQDGLNGIPGLLKHWLSPVAWRLIFVFFLYDISYSCQCYLWSKLLYLLSRSFDSGVECWKSKHVQLSHETRRPALHQRRVPSPHWGLCHGFDFSICRNFIAFVKLGTFLRRHSQSIPKWWFLWCCRGLRADAELNTSDWSTLSAACGLAGAILLGGPLSTEQQSQLELCNSFGSLFHEPSLGARLSFYNPCVALLHMAMGAAIWHGWGSFLFSGLGQKVWTVRCLFSDAFLAPLPLRPGARD